MRRFIQTPATGLHRARCVSSALLHEAESLSSLSEQRASESVSESRKSNYISIGVGNALMAALSDQKQGRRFWGESRPLINLAEPTE